jgi:anti-sigma regulatory factor (Ser/Thr protein kinase)
MRSPNCLIPKEMRVGTAFREVLTNAIEQGGRLDPKQQVEISYVRARHMVTCRISDPGEGFYTGRDSSCLP